MQSHYEITVSLNGKHFFATAPRSCVTVADAEKVYIELLARFPVAQGFRVSCTYWQCAGERVDFNE